MESIVDEPDNRVITLEAKTTNADVYEKDFASTDSAHTELSYNQATRELTVSYQTAEKKTKITGITKTYTVNVKKLSELEAKAFEFTKVASDVLAVETTTDDKVVIYGTDDNRVVEESDIKVQVTVSLETEADETNNKCDGIIKVTTTSDDKKVIKVTYGSGTETYVKTFEYEYITVPSKDQLAIALANPTNTFTNLAIKESEKEGCDGTISLTTADENASVSYDNTSLFTGTIDGKSDSTHAKVKYDADSEKLIVCYITANGTEIDVISKTYDIEILITSSLEAGKFTFTDAKGNILAVENEDRTIAIYRTDTTTELSTENITAAIQSIESATIKDISVSEETENTSLKITYVSGEKTYVATLPCKYVNVPTDENPLTLGLANAESDGLKILPGTDGENDILLVSNEKTVDEIGNNFTITTKQDGMTWNDYVVISYAETESSESGNKTKTGTITVNFYTKGTKDKAENSLYKMEKQYVVYKQASESGVINVTKKDDASVNIANVIQDKENGSIKVYCDLTNIQDSKYTPQSTDLYSEGNSIVLQATKNEGKQEAYILSVSGGTYVKYGVTTLTKVASIEGVTLSKNEESEKSIEIEGNAVIYKKYEDDTEKITSEDFAVSDAGTIQLVLDEEKTVIALYMEKGYHYVSFNVTEKTVPNVFQSDWDGKNFRFEVGDIKELKYVETRTILNSCLEDVDAVYFYIDGEKELELGELEKLPVTVVTYESEGPGFPEETTEGKITKKTDYCIYVTYTERNKIYKKEMRYVTVDVTKYLNAGVSKESTNVVYCEKKSSNTGNEKLMVLLADNCNLTSEDFAYGIPAEDGYFDSDIRMDALYNNNILTVGFWDKENTDMFAGKTFEVEEIRKATEVSNAEEVSLKAASDSHVVKEAVIEKNSDGTKVVTVTAATNTEGTLEKIAATDFSVADGYTVYVADSKTEGKTLYLVSDTDKTYIEYEINVKEVTDTSGGTTPEETASGDSVE